jgi:hypothetical protein
LLKQFGTRRSSTLHENVHILRRKKFFHRTRNLLHVAIAGEKDERPAVSFLNEMCNPMFEGFVITSVARIGHLLDHEHLHLLLKIEGATELQRLGFRCPDARTQIGEVRTANSQSGAGHHATAVLAKEHPSQHRREIDGGGV